MPLTIIRDDITRFEGDAVVNAANSELLCGGGVCGAIFEAAGRDRLSEACGKIGHCDTGKAVITKGFGLKARYIIHTVGPVYGRNPEHEEGQLYSCYRNSLMLAKENKIASIAFPLISSGIYGYPRNEALRIATDAIRDFLEENEMQVYLVVYDKSSFEISRELFLSVESYIEDHLVKIRPRSEREEELLFSDDTCEDSCGISYEAQSISFSDSDFGEPVEIAEKKIQSAKAKRNTSDKESSACGSVGKRAFAAAPSFNASVASPPPRSLADLVSRKTETFSEMLLRLIDEKGMTDVEVYKRANIDRKLFSKIRKKDYIPKKITVIALAVGLKLNMDEARDLLGRAGYAFSEASKFDIIIEYFIENKKYDIFEINEALFAFDEQPLGA
ncbi:MAG: macro domain-containing protein [Ruminococcaceae bacterium]|nr:macro domain-containing protein [Oscillospiraceae bacterium]